VKRIAAVLAAPLLSAGASYDLDLFGKLKSATAAARAQLLATQAAYDSVRWVLVSQVATSYFQLRELDAVLDLSQRAAKDREQSLELVKLPGSTTANRPCKINCRPNNRCIK
jgi:multidrug efflux system outer membrane protein